MNILITRVREGSLSGSLFNTIRGYARHDVDCLSHTWDITYLDTYPDNLCDYDVVFNCSGRTLNQSVLDMDKYNAIDVFKINVVGAMMLTSAYAYERSRLGLHGLIVHVGSVGSRKVFTNCSAYCASKAALAHYIQCAGYELKDKDISVIGVHPGNIKGTKMTKQVQDELINVRGMSKDRIDNIYEGAHDVDNVADFMYKIIEMPWEDITGENFYLGQGWKG